MLRNNMPRILFVIAFLFVFSTFVDRTAYFISAIDVGYGSLARDVAYLISLSIYMFVGWNSFDAVPKLASYLGFKNVLDQDLSSDRGKNTNTSNQKDAEGAFIDATKTYKTRYCEQEPLEALNQARTRIEHHITKLQNSSIFNLLIGVAIAIIGIFIIGTTFFEIEKYVDKQVGFNTNGFMIFVFLPRLSMAFFVQIFPLFFIVMYRSNINEIKYFQNEITNIDLIAAAASLLTAGSEQNKKIVITSLLKTERNRLAKKGEVLLTHTSDDVSLFRESRINRNAKAIYPKPKPEQKT